MATCPIRPLTDWLVVQVDPPRKRSGIIEIAGDNDTSAVRTGTVLRLGPGKPMSDGSYAPMYVTEGSRICFFRWHQEHRPGKAIADALAKSAISIDGDIMMIRLGDILFEFDGDVEVDIP